MYKPEHYSLIGNATTKDARLLRSQDVEPKKFVRLEKNIDQFNFWQKTILTDSFSGFEIVRTKPIVSVTPLLKKYFEYEFITRGVVDLRKIFFEVEINNSSELKLLYNAYLPGIILVSFLDSISITFGNSEMKLEQLGPINGYDLSKYLFFYNYNNVEKKVVESLGGFFTTEKTFSYLPILQELFREGDYQDKRKIIVPLWILHPFFKQKRTFLPNDLKIKIKMTFQNNNWIQHNFGDLVYESNILKTDLAMQLNKQWMLNKLLYNYIDIHKKIFILERGSNKTTIPLIINSFRPTSFLIAIQDQRKERYEIKVNLDLFGSRIKKISIKSNKSRIETDIIFTNSRFANYFENLNQNDSQLKSELYTPLNSDFGRFRDSIAPIHFFSLDPNRIFNKNIMSLDNPTQNITIDIEYEISEGSLTEQLNLIVYYSIPSQLRISPEKNCEIVRWPVLGSIDSQSSILNTFNNN